MTIPDAAIGAIIGACIAALLSFLGLVASKEQKTSEFRQAWIDAVREDVAQVISSTHAIFLELKAQEGDVKLAWPVVRDNVLMANTVAARLRLRLNDDEEQSHVILNYIKTLEDLLLIWQPAELAKLKSELVEITDHLLPEACGKMLKTEWTRVKAGEPIFRVAKWLALAVLVGLLGVGAAHWLFRV